MILAEGTPRTVTMRDESTQVISYVGTSGEGDLALVGIGIRIKDDDTVWFHTPGPYVRLVNLLAARLVLDSLPAYSERVLGEAVLFATEAHQGDSELEVRESILALLDGNLTAYTALVKKVREYRPDYEIFNWMLSELHNERIPIDTDELYELVQQGQLVRTEFIELHDRLRAARQEGFEFYRELVEAPLAYTEWSLGDFLSSFGIRTLAEPVPDGAVGATFERRYDVKETDMRVKEASARPHGKPLQLWHVSGLFGTSLRERAIPVTIADRGGDQYTLTEAAYRNGEIYVLVLVKSLNGNTSIQEYTVANLRFWVRPATGVRKVLSQLTSK